MVAVNLGVQEQKFLWKAKDVAQHVEQPERVPALNLLKLRWGFRSSLLGGESR